ncbi:MBL fold metallo-hydrolase [Halobacterium sp. CBA1126]|uniref:MBL fold metallo-hydrolase n=1 Tax=Halobacterium sp. CBA1126 TaxID=2668074 RepID=UPI001329113D|nr:MBL fold metallo-hydrolase [Halobacterium sp. CBA1126]
MHHIQLSNTAFEGANSVYLLGDGDADAPTTLVDAGVASADVEAELRAALGDRGVAFADVDRLLLTHWHHDHAGLAGAIQSESGADVSVHEADAPLVAQSENAREDLHAAQEAALREWGLPDEEREGLLRFSADHRYLRGDPVDVTPVSDGDTVALGAFEAEVVHLPGHAAGLVAYVVEHEWRREAFVGDAVLPKYTPNVGGADVRVDRPLARYLESLERVQSLDLDRAWPGHRGPIFAVSERAGDIAAHHDERTARVERAVADLAPATPWAVSAELFGSLSGIHVLHGPGEAYAHLDHLAREGVLRETPDGYVPA